MLCVTTALKPHFSLRQQFRSLMLKTTVLAHLFFVTGKAILKASVWELIHVTKACKSYLARYSLQLSTPGKYQGMWPSRTWGMNLLNS